MKYRLKKFIRSRYNISFSKSGDDIQLMKLINNSKPGAYVDIGSWHPITASNTYYFSLRNWKGICIDPNPELKDLYKQFRPKDFFVNVGIGESRIPMEYYVLEESSMNTFDYDFIIKKKLVNKIKQKITVPVRTLEEILEENLNAHDRLDFFDVDVEGRDLEVLKTNNWNKYRPKVIMVESDTPLISGISSDIVQYLEQKDYRVIGKSIIQGDLGNIFLISK